jgi:metal-responsive CopG/Arc/MetJ family transcriptional regulator
MTKPGYAGFSIKKELAEEIEKIIEDPTLGYSNKTDFIRDAIRKQLRKIRDGE